MSSEEYGVCRNPEVFMEQRQGVRLAYRVLRFLCAGTTGFVLHERDYARLPVLRTATCFQSMKDCLLSINGLSLPSLQPEEEMKQIAWFPSQAFSILPKAPYSHTVTESLIKCNHVIFTSKRKQFPFFTFPCRLKKNVFCPDSCIILSL